ncbi:hypothetical protein Tco_1041007 [Tanacetum coccineum]|uniref:Uncharacterized protein n=1 Tax=Tanacetum coccineum TaxID=301880 RepID=A0ABQ5GEY3_9ASTR
MEYPKVNVIYDSEGDILFLEELLSNNSTSLPENESFHFDIPSSPRPPAKPLDDGIYFEPDTGLLTTKVLGNISENYVLMPRLLPTQPTLCPVIDTLLPFSSKNEDKVHLLSHRGFKAFQVFFESLMMIYGGDIPILDVPIARIFEASRARVFDTLLPFSSENEDNVFNPGILASNEEKSPHLLSHRGFKAFQLISESPMMISRGDIPILDVPFLHFYPP